MPELLDSLTSYPALAVFCFFCGMGIPLPEDVPQLFAGLQVQRGLLDVVPTLAVLVGAIFARDCVFFYAGRTIGLRALEHPMARRVIGDERIRSAQQMVQDRGPMAVLIGRFSVGFRVPVFFVSGAMGVSPRHFAQYDGAALLMSAPTLMGVGYLFGEPAINAAIQVASGAPWMIAVLAVLLAGGWLWRRQP